MHDGTRREGDDFEQKVYIIMKVNAFTIEAYGTLNAVKTPVTVYFGAQNTSGIALWDTGASRTCVSQRLIKALGLPLTVFDSIITAAGVMPCGVYCVDILLPGDILIKNIKVLDIPDTTACDVLIGMDVICRGDLAISNAANATWVSFRSPPNEEHIDFKSA